MQAEGAGRGPLRERLRPVRERRERARPHPDPAIVRRGLLAAQWGPAERADMTFSISKSYLALLALLGVEKGVDSQGLFSAWRTFFERLAASQPVVMLFEDFHHADKGLLDFVDNFMEWTRGVPITVITLARPELLEKRPDWGAGKRSFASIHLEPLPAAAMAELLAGLVPGLPEKATAAIVARIPVGWWP